MWRMRKLGYKSVPDLEALKKQWREKERELRKARRAQHLISKRLLLDTPAAEEPLDNLVSYALSEQQVIQIIKDLKHESAKRIDTLTTLRHSLQREDVRLMFIKAEGSIQLLIGLFTCSFADVQLESARCFHELSQSDDSSVSQSCLPVTSYLLTYLSGNSPEFTEICLYVLGNLIVEGEATRNQLLLQGIIPALALCTQSPHVSVLEAVGYTLSQLLASKEAPEKIIPIVLESAIPEAILNHLHFESEDRIGVAVEFGWSLHYIISSQVNNILLISQGIVPKLVQLLSDLSELALKRAPPDLELESLYPQPLHARYYAMPPEYEKLLQYRSGLSAHRILICPLVRCVGNLLTDVDRTGNRVQIHDGRLLVALFVFIEQYHKDHQFLLTECLWAINNLTVEDPVVASALLHYDMVPVLMKFLLTSAEIAAMVLTIFCSLADLGPVYCEHLRQKNILSCLISILDSTDVQVTLRSLDVMIYLFHHCPDLTRDFLHNYGLHVLQPYKNNLQFQEQVRTIWNLCFMQTKEDKSSSME